MKALLFFEIVIWLFLVVLFSGLMLGDRDSPCVSTHSQTRAWSVETGENCIVMLPHGRKTCSYSLEDGVTITTSGY